MHILITGAAGMIGRKLVARLVKDGQLNGQKIDHLTLIDVVAPEKARSRLRRATFPIRAPPRKPSPKGRR
jgi:nucleoside-diphosphate-sugar epimerase